MSAERIVPPHELASAARQLMEMGLPPEAAFHVASVSADILEKLEADGLIVRYGSSVELTEWGLIALEAILRVVASPQR